MSSWTGLCLWPRNNNAEGVKSTNKCRMLSNLVFNASSSIVCKFHGTRFNASPQPFDLSAAAFTSLCFQDSVHSLPPNHLKRFHGILGAYKTMPKGRSAVNVGWRTGDRTRSAGCQFIGKKSTRLPRWNGSQIWILQLMNNSGQIYVKIACKLSSMPDID